VFVSSFEAGSGHVAVWTGAGKGPGNTELVANGADEVIDLSSWSPLAVKEPTPPALPNNPALLFGSKEGFPDGQTRVAVMGPGSVFADRGPQRVTEHRIPEGEAPPGLPADSFFV